MEDDEAFQTRIDDSRLNDNREQIGIGHDESSKSLIQFDAVKNPPAQDGRKTLNINNIIVPVQSIEDEQVIEEIKVAGDSSQQSSSLR